MAKKVVPAVPVEKIEKVVTVEKVTAEKSVKDVLDLLVKAHELCIEVGSSKRKKGESDTRINGVRNELNRHIKSLRDIC